MGAAAPPRGGTPDLPYMVFSMDEVVAVHVRFPFLGIQRFKKTGVPRGDTAASRVVVDASASICEAAPRHRGDGALRCVGDGKATASAADGYAPNGACCGGSLLC